MLLIKFSIGEEDYAIESSSVKAIIPLVKLKSIQCSEAYILGVINYQSTPVPVIDINILCNIEKTKDILTTRLIIVDHSKQETIAIKAENVTETIYISEDSLHENKTNQKYSDFLGPIFEIKGNLTQILQSEKIISENVRRKLFSDDQSPKVESEGY